MIIRVTLDCIHQTDGRLASFWFDSTFCLLHINLDRGDCQKWWWVRIEKFWKSGNKFWFLVIYWVFIVVKKSVSDRICESEQSKNDRLKEENCSVCKSCDFTGEHSSFCDCLHFQCPLSLPLSNFGVWVNFHSLSNDIWLRILLLTLYKCVISIPLLVSIQWPIFCI